MDLAPDVRAAVLDADAAVFEVIPEEYLRPLADKARQEAAAAGVRLNRLAAEYVAASIAYGATIWFGHDRNVPRPLSDGLVPQEVRWRLLSELRRE
ncbi:MAG: hypothetical protein OXG52_07635 [bacterium]|nr:hypothetical protein [bacterium]